MITFSYVIVYFLQNIRLLCWNIHDLVIFFWRLANDAEWKGKWIQSWLSIISPSFWSFFNTFFSSFSPPPFFSFLRFAIFVLNPNLGVHKEPSESKKTILVKTCAAAIFVAIDLLRSQPFFLLILPLSTQFVLIPIIFWRSSTSQDLKYLIAAFKRINFFFDAHKFLHCHLRCWKYFSQILLNVKTK